jgi:hypothetical protein
MPFTPANRRAADSPMIEPEEPRHFKLKQLDASTLCRIAGRDVSKTTKNLSETCTWFWNNVDHVPIENPTGKEPRYDESGFSLLWPALIESIRQPLAFWCLR